MEQWPVLLETKKSKGRKDRLNQWVVMRNPQNREEVGQDKHFGIGNFNGDFWQNFFWRNNELVGSALTVGYDLDGWYHSFFTLGMRAAQQLDGKYADITFEKYTEIAQGLETNLLEHAKIFSKNRRNERLEKLITDSESVSDEDKGYIVGMVGKLMEEDIEIPKRELGIRGLAAKVDRIIKDRNDELLQYFPKVDDSLKAQFLHVVKCSKFEDIEIDYVDGLVDEIYGIMSEIGVENSRNYLTFLLGNLRRGNRDFYSDCIQCIGYELGDLSDEQKGFYFAALGRVEEVGYDCSSIIASDAVKLVPSLGSEKVLAIVDEALAQNDTGWNALGHMQKATRSAKVED